MGAPQSVGDFKGLGRRGRAKDKADQEERAKRHRNLALLDGLKKSAGPWRPPRLSHCCQLPFRAKRIGSKAAHSMPRPPRVAGGVNGRPDRGQGGFVKAVPSALDNLGVPQIPAGAYDQAQDHQPFPASAAGQFRIFGHDALNEARPVRIAKACLHGSTAASTMCATLTIRDGGGRPVHRRRPCCRALQFAVRIGICGRFHRHRTALLRFNRWRRFFLDFGCIFFDDPDRFPWLGLDGAGLLRRRHHRRHGHSLPDRLRTSRNRHRRTGIFGGSGRQACTRNAGYKADAEHDIGQRPVHGQGQTQKKNQAMQQHRHAQTGQGRKTASPRFTGLRRGRKRGALALPELWHVKTGGVCNPD